MKDYAAIATQYARDVVDGRILACKWVKLACSRHLKNLEQDAAGWRYTWNPLLITPEGKEYRPADRVCLLGEMLPHIKGDWAARGELIELQPWDIFVFASIFGWIDRETKKRRFRTADLFVPRKNAKSTKGAIIGLYMLAADGEHGAEVYSGATSEDQAKEVFTPARLMTDRTPEFRKRFGIVTRATSVSIGETNSKFEPVIGRPGDGASPSCAIVDEYHEHATEELYDTMKTGMGARSQPLMLVLTTSGDDVSGPCYAHQVELQQILEGVIEDEQRFGIIFTIDDGDDWTTEEALIKANPNYGVSVDAEFLLTQQRDAIRDTRKQATFQTKHLNIWINSSSPWLNMHDWKRNADPALKLKHFARERAYGGVDLANTTDIAGCCTCFKRLIGGVEHFYYFWRHYLPEDTIQAPENKHYQAWQRAGLLIATDGSMIDQKRIETDLLADRDRFQMEELAIDNWGAAGFAPAMEVHGFTVVRIPMNVQHLSAPMKYIDGLNKAGRLHHNGDPIATWAVSNVGVKPDANDNWFPRRGARAKKIDPALAMIMATARAMVGADNGSIDSWLRSATTPPPAAPDTASARRSMA